MKDHVRNDKPAVIFTLLKVYTRKHRKATIVLAIAALLGVATPFAVSALSNDSNTSVTSTGSSENQAAKPQGAQNSSNNQHNSQGDSTVKANNTTNVTVNGESVAVPDNGSYSKTIQNPDGQTKVDVDSSHSSSSNSNGSSVSNTSNSSVNIRVDSESHSSSTGQQ